MIRGKVTQAGEAQVEVSLEGLAHLLTSNGEALLGMSLLGGSRLTIDAIPGGDVTVEELP